LCYERKKLKVDFSKLDRAFNPECVAVVGDSKAGNFQWLRGQSDFKGKLYSVHVNPETIAGIEALGVENYTSLVDIPEPVDFVIVSVPRAAAPAVLEDCIRKEAGAAHFFTSGFAETDTEEGVRLERLLTDMAEKANFHVVGPNCRGIYNPGIGLKQIGDQYSGTAGPLGFITQSGTYAMTFSREAHLQGVDINKSVSFGNGIVLNGTDYLEYFGQDPEIKVIAMYLEGIKDGRRFFRVLREVAASKPVVMWKGGWTEDGGRAVGSHTASLAVPKVIWDTAIKQCGVIQVMRMEELVDTLKALIYLPPVYGNRVGIAGGSGGPSIAITDEFAAAGLRVPLLTQQSYDELDTFFSLIGGSYRNPVDTDTGLNRRELRRIMEILERDTSIDNIVLITVVASRSRNPNQLEADIDSLVNIKKKTSKPVMAILPDFTLQEMGEAADITRKFQDEGIPVFPSMERGARALKNALDYYTFKNSLEK